MAFGLAFTVAWLSGCDKSQPAGSTHGETTAEKKIANVKCPMMGTKLDPAKVPASLTREFEGKKVGFCCPGCPEGWDKLSAEQKRQKLTAVLPPTGG